MQFFAGIQCLTVNTLYLTICNTATIRCRSLFNEISISPSLAVRAYLCIDAVDGFNELGEFTLDNECADIGDATSRELLITRVRVYVEND